MFCLRCGKDTKCEDTFCASCLASMQAYPVKQDTPVFLPDRNAYIASQKQQIQTYVPTAEEQLHHQRKTIRALIAAIAVLSAVLLFVAGLLLFTLKTAMQTPQSNNLGRNYTAVHPIE